MILGDTIPHSFNILLDRLHKRSKFYTDDNKYVCKEGFIIKIRYLSDLGCDVVQRIVITVVEGPYVDKDIYVGEYMTERDRRLYHDLVDRLLGDDTII